MSFTSSTERAAHYCPEAHTARQRIVSASSRNGFLCSLISIRSQKASKCSQHTTSHTRVPSYVPHVAYSGVYGASNPVVTQASADSSTPLSQAAIGRDIQDAVPASQSAQLSSPSSMVALMEAWGHLSTRLQPNNSTGSSSDSEDSVISQLILSALKLAVRSLSRASADNTTGSYDSGSFDSATALGTSSKPAVQRSLALAAALAELYANGLPLDAASIAAGIVADAVDAAALHIRTVQAKLGQEVAGLVHDVLAVRHAPDRAQIYDDANSSALRGWLLSAYDVRACAIEVVWRWLGLAQPPSQPYQQQLMAMEALTIYCPLGHALGLGVCATALEDGAFKVLFPSSYASTARQVLPYSGAAAELLARCQATLQVAAAADTKFNQLAAGVQLLTRTKSLYSIMRKLLRLQDPAAGSRRLGEMYDLLGMRAVVKPRQDLPEAAAEAAAVEACYRLQELAHQQWAPAPGRSKDYIAHPKINGYQSLHSTLQLQQWQHDSNSSSSGSSAVVLSYLELQIRTAAMHAAAEGGDAAHAGYKGRLERRQVRHLQQWTTQLQRRLAAPQQQLLLSLPHADDQSSSSSSSSSVSSVPSYSSLQSVESMLQPTYSTLVTSSSDSEVEDTLSSSSIEQQQQMQQQSQVYEQQPGATGAAAASLFHHLDLDGDGMLSLYELTELLSELGDLSHVSSQHAESSCGSTAGAAGQHQLTMHSGLARLQSSCAPAAAAASGHAAATYAQQVFELLDTNGDGLISMAEFLEFYMANTPRQQQQQQHQMLDTQVTVSAVQSPAQVEPQSSRSSNVTNCCSVSQAGTALHSSVSLSSSSRSIFGSRQLGHPGVVLHGWYGCSSSLGYRVSCQAYPSHVATSAASSNSDTDSVDTEGTGSNMAPNDVVGSWPVITAGRESRMQPGSLPAAQLEDVKVESSNSDLSSAAGTPQQPPQQQQPEAVDAYQQQLLMELSFEEDEQQQRRQLRQQQRQLPSLLGDAAVGQIPRYVLVPQLSSTASDASLMTDRLGQPIQQLEVPCVGPLLVTNAPHIFRSADVVLSSPSDCYERLVLLLELVKPVGSGEAILQARNLSRVGRGRMEKATMQINGGHTLLEPHRAAVELVAGDTVEIPELDLVFAVRLQDDQLAGHPAVSTLQRYCGLYAAQRLGLTDLPVSAAMQQLQEQHQQIYLQHQQQLTMQGVQQQDVAADAAAAAADSYSNLEAELRQISRLVRVDARAAEVQLAQLAVSNPAAAAPWFLWAQLAASTRRPWMARDLFKAAAVCQQQQLQQSTAAGASSPSAVVLSPPPPQQSAVENTADAAPADVAEASSTGKASVASSVSQRSRSSQSIKQRSERSAEFRLSSRLVQVLRVWAKLEWDQRLFGPARRLWRLAANEAFRFPYEISAEGGGAVLHTWATAEFERDNVLNARVVIGEALRKCPKDAAVAVLAGSIEASAGDHNTARALFMRAYQLNKADKRLYMYWPKMEGEAGNIDRARLLFKYGLSLYPNNTKILNLYACFEEQQGSPDLARELHRRALGIDNSSLTSMHNRVSWASLELRQGNLDEARQLLREGLDLHPNFAAAMLLVAKLERQQGQLDVAEAYVRRVMKVGQPFSLAAIGEMREIYLARGEHQLARNLARHLRCSEEMQAQKQSGRLHGNEAWISYYKDAVSSEQQDVIGAAWQRKRELGYIRQPESSTRRRRRARYSRGAADADSNGASSRVNGKAGHKQSPQQQQHHQQGGSEQESDSSVVDAFDFGAAAAAVAESLLGHKQL